jgi:hypothetical protein
MNIEEYLLATELTGPIFDPRLADILKESKRDVMASINCIHIGTIESYDSLTNTASVSINFKRKLMSGEELDLPLLGECPVFILTGGAASITLPIAKGDTCIVLFNDRNLDDWWTTGLVKSPADNRMHSLSDGIVIVGIRSLLNSPNSTPNVLGINAGSNNLIEIKNSLNSLYKLIESLIGVIKGLKTIGSATAQGIDPASVLLLEAELAKWALLFK